MAQRNDTQSTTTTKHLNELFDCESKFKVPFDIFGFPIEIPQIPAESIVRAKRRPESMLKVKF